MYREMKDSDKEKESGKMVRLTSVPLCMFLWLFKQKQNKSYCSFWNATLKKLTVFNYLKDMSEYICKCMLL